jgi:hypothetical protein
MGALLRHVSAVAIPLLLSSSSYAQSANPFFVPPSYPGTGQAVTADFNGDGKPDLIFADGTVLLGKGDGTFTVGTPLGLAGLNSGTPIATADFNGDGKPDLMVASTSVNISSVLLGNGDGTFQAPINTAIPAPTGALLVGDLNGDGKPDVLTGSGLSYLGKGNGAFLAGVPSGAPRPGPFDRLADFDGDGKADLFTIGAGIQLGNGNGTFQALLPFPTGALTGFVVGDFDGDGKLDVAGFGGTLTNRELQVLFGKGDGTFRAGPVEVEPPGTLPLDYGPAVDLNKDGKADLTFGSSSAFEVLLSNGDGSFTVGQAYSTANQYNQFGVAASNIVAADFNGDGKLDVAAFNTLLLGNGDGSLQGDQIIPGLRGTSAVAGDFNRDGHPDLAFIRAGTASNENLDIWLNDGKANFSLAHTYQIPVPNVNSPVTLTGVADLNGDGHLDLVGYIDSKSAWSVVALLGNGDGSFGPPIISSGAPSGFFIQGFTLADLTGDGKPDLIVVIANMLVDGRFSVLLNNGDGTFAAPVEYFAGIPDSNVVAADFNKDGKLDAIVGTDGNGIAVLLGNGDGTFQPTTYLTNATCALACGSTTSLAAFDFNGDGNEDLVVATNSATQVLLGKGDGSFTALAPTAATIGLLQIADFNGDGKADLLGQHTTGGAQLGAFLLGNGDGTFGSLLPLIPGGDGLIGDFNGDGKPDIIAGNVLLLNTTATDFQVTASALSPASLAPGSSTSGTITLTPFGGFRGAVALSCVGLPPGANCSFEPATLLNGSGTSTLTITTTAETPATMYSMGVVGTSGGLKHQISIALTITAADFSLTPGSTSTATVAPGQTATYMLSLAASTGFSPMVTLTCSGTPTGPACGISPATVTLSGTTAATATVTVTTKAASLLLLPGANERLKRIKLMLLLVYLLALLALGRLYRSRAKQSVGLAPLLAVTLLLYVGFALTSCGGGSSGRGGVGGTGTAAGTYVITVSATATTGSTALTHSTKLTLIVQ